MGAKTFGAKTAGYGSHVEMGFAESRVDSELLFYEAQPGMNALVALGDEV